MSIITAKFWRTKEDGYTNVFLKSETVEDLIKASCAVPGQTTPAAFGDWQVSLDGGLTWAPTAAVYRAPWEQLQQCGFPTIDTPIGMWDDRESRVGGYAIATKGLGNGVHFRTRRPIIPATLKQAAAGLEKAVMSLLETGRAIDITVAGLVKPEAR